jgi:very-short-patch-repair endonuclease
MPPLAFYSHSTAALLFGIPIPYGSERDDSLHVTLPAPARAPHATGIQGHRLSIREGDVTEVDGVRRTTPARTWCDLASILSLVDLVAAGDFLIHHRSPLVSIGQLAAAVGLHKNRRGLRKLREALLLLSDRSESPPESVLRVLLIQAGFPEPHINHSVNDRFGEFVARSDFIIEEYRLILEYQGDYHRTTKGQWRADMTRRSKLEAEGWKVMELNADDLRDPIELMTRIWARARQS